MGVMMAKQRQKRLKKQKAALQAKAEEEKKVPMTDKKEKVSDGTYGNRKNKNN